LTATWEDPYNDNNIWTHESLVGIFSSKSKAEKALQEEKEEYVDYIIKKIEVL